MPGEPGTPTQCFPLVDRVYPAHGALFRTSFRPRFLPPGAVRLDVWSGSGILGPMNRVKTAIVGASGYSGEQLVRLLLRHPGVELVTLVDLDPEMTRLFSTQPLLTQLNAGALASPKVRVVNADAFAWLATNTQRFDFVVADFPDPSNFSLGKLFTTAFYGRLRSALASGGAVVVQSTSPYVARRSFWCVDETLRASGYLTEPYHLYVPSFGEWGFILASPEPLPQAMQIPPGLRFLTGATARDLFTFPPDMSRVVTEVNRLNNQALVRYFEEEWGRYAP